MDRTFDALSSKAKIFQRFDGEFLLGRPMGPLSPADASGNVVPEPALQKQRVRSFPAELLLLKQLLCNLEVVDQVDLHLAQLDQGKRVCRDSCVKIPAEKGLWSHVQYLRELLDTGVISELWWLDTRDMHSDGLTKGSVDRAALHAIMEGSVSYKHEYHSWQPKKGLTARPGIQIEHDEEAGLIVLRL